MLFHSTFGGASHPTQSSIAWGEVKSEKFLVLGSWFLAFRVQSSEFNVQRSTFNNWGIGPPFGIRHSGFILHPFPHADPAHDPRSPGRL